MSTMIDELSPSDSGYISPPNYFIDPDYYTPSVPSENPSTPSVPSAEDEYTYDSLGNMYKNGTLFRAVETEGDAVHTPGLPSVIPGFGDITPKWDN